MTPGATWKCVALHAMAPAFVSSDRRYVRDSPSPSVFRREKLTAEGFPRTVSQWYSEEAARKHRELCAGLQQYAHRKCLVYNNDADAVLADLVKYFELCLEHKLDVLLL